MRLLMKSTSVCCLLLASLVPGLVSAQIWQDLQADLPQAAARSSGSTPTYYRALKADSALLTQGLAAAPLENSSTQGAILPLPLPDGSTAYFEVENSPLLSPELAAAYPEIQTYRVRGVDDPSVSGRLDMTSAGFHAILSTPGGTVFIDPDGAGNYRSFYKQDYAEARAGESEPHVCHLEELPVDQTASAGAVSNLSARTVSSQTQRRIYRLAVATTGEYSRYFGGSETAIASNVVTTINRVNQVYGRDLAVQLKLTHLLIYMDPSSDPYGSTILDNLQANQDAIDHAIGIDNYDIGHLFGLSGGGLAFVGSVCGTDKAQGFTGAANPVGDAFYIDYVAHEMGHQLGAYHTFNGSTGACEGANRTAASAVEPGSGSTIMAYAGICGTENLQSTSDDVFHAKSIQEIRGFVTGSGSVCGTVQTLSNGLPATVEAGPMVTLPKGTPFVLTGTVDVDPDGDTLSYQWDEMDANGTATTSETFGDDRGDNPLFRSFVPVDTPTRYFPRLSSLLNGSVDGSEKLPTTTRQLNFRLTVRDGNSGVVHDDRTLNVNGALGPFAITSATLTATTLDIAWNPAGTASICDTLDVSLIAFSSDGATYCDASDNAALDINPVTPINNADGSASIILPTTLTFDRARVKLACANNVFFALSGQDLALAGSQLPVASDCRTTDGATVVQNTVFTSASGYATLVNGSSGGGGGGGALLLLPIALMLLGVFMLGRR